MSIATYELEAPQAAGDVPQAVSFALCKNDPKDPVCIL
jgi:hypothetical protein